MPLTRLRPIEHLSQVDKIELRLQEYLRNEEFNPGDPLPKEMEIAKDLGVSVKGGNRVRLYASSSAFRRAMGAPPERMRPEAGAARL